MTSAELGFFGTALMAQSGQPTAGGSAPAPQAPAPQAPAPQAPTTFNVPGATSATGTTQAPALPPGATGQQGAGGGGPGGLGLFLPLAVVLVLMMVMTSMSGRKERKKRDALLSAIKRGDRVQTSGGVIGTIVDLGDQELTLRVDETTNTRIRFARSAVQSVLSGGRDSVKTEVEVKPKGQTAATT